MAEEVKVPDVGDVDEVEVIEVLVSEGDTVEEDQGLVTLESDKASMDVPSPRAGKIASVDVSVGDKVSTGSIVAHLESEDDDAGEDESERDAEESDDAEGSDEDDEPDEDEEQEEEGDESDEKTDEEDEPKSKPKPSKTKSSGEGDVHGQVVVLGAGPGGYTAAFRAADLGQKVVLIERYPDLGGVCLNVGCIPSKALLHTAQIIEEVDEFSQHGLIYGEPRIDLDKLRKFKNKVVGRLTGGLTQLAKKRDVTVIHGTAQLASEHTLTVETDDGETTVSFDHLILAAGSRVIELPGIPMDDPRIMDSTGALELEDIPKRLLVVGGGIIGLEMASVYSALGSAVTVVELTDGLMPGTDRDLVRPLQKRIKTQYENIFLSTKVTEAKPTKQGIEVHFEGDDAPEKDVFDRVLVSVGRRPNGDRLNLEAAGVEVDDKGFVPVDAHMRTNEEHIFAIGDLARPPLLAHKASHEGKVAAEVAAGEKSAFDARVIPSVAYTDPEVAWVGLTETEAKENGTDYEKGTFPWSANGRSLGMSRSEGLTKLLFDPETKRILGAGIVGSHAGDLISELVLAIEMDCEAADIGLSIHPHPTLSETTAMAAEAFEGTLTDLYVPKRGKK